MLGSLIVLNSGCTPEQTTTAKRKDIVDAVFATGHIAMEDEYLVTAGVEGYIETVFVNEGDSVHRDEALYAVANEVTAAQLATAQANYQDAQKRLEEHAPQIRQLEAQIQPARKMVQTDSINLERYRKLVKTQAVSTLEYERAQLQYASSLTNLQVQQAALEELVRNLELNVENARHQLTIQRENNDNYFLSSAIDGLVLHQYKQSGELVRRGETVAKIGGGPFQIRLFIAEEDIRFIRLGQKALITLNTDKEKIRVARVSKIYPAFDQQEQSFVIEARFDETPEGILADTQLKANIIIAEKEQALVIPSAYLTETDKVQLPGRDTLQTVKLGIHNIEWTEILEGLEEGQTIILPQNT